MKKLITLLVALALSCASASAQMGTVGNSVLGGAALGGIAGAVIGNNSRGHDSAKGALIGVAAGGLIGAVVGQQRVINRQHPIIARPEYAPPAQRAYQQANPYQWEPSTASYGQWVPNPPERTFVNHRQESTVIIVQNDHRGDRISEARARLANANARAEQLRAAYEQARSEARAAEHRLDALENGGGNRYR